MEYFFSVHIWPNGRTTSEFCQTVTGLVYAGQLWFRRSICYNGRDVIVALVAICTSGKVSSYLTNIYKRLVSSVGGLLNFELK